MSKSNLTKEDGSALLLVVVLCGVMAFTLSVVSVYTINQSNYINRIREAYQMMSVTESLAKSAAHAVNLAASAVSRGVADGSPCTAEDATLILKTFNGKKYCLRNAAVGGQMGQICVTRPDKVGAAATVCSVINFGQYNIQYEGKENNLYAQLEMQMPKEEGVVYSLVSKLAKKMPFTKISNREVAAWVNKNTQSPTDLIAGVYGEITNDVPLFERNLSYAQTASGQCSSLPAGLSCSSTNFPSPPTLSGDVNSDQTLVTSYLEGLNAAATCLCYKQATGNQDGYLGNQSQVDTLAGEGVHFLTALMANPDLVPSSNTNLRAQFDGVREKVGAQLWNYVRDRTSSLSGSYAALELGSGTQNPPGNGGGGVDLAVIKVAKRLNTGQAGLKVDDAANIIPCQQFNNCASVIANGNDNANRRFLQRVFVVE